jgi:hypothetical protein
LDVRTANQRGKETLVETVDVSESAPTKQSRIHTAAQIAARRQQDSTDRTGVPFPNPFVVAYVDESGLNC